MRMRDHGLLSFLYLLCGQLFRLFSLKVGHFVEVQDAQAGNLSDHVDPIVRQLSDGVVD